MKLWLNGIPLGALLHRDFLRADIPSPAIKYITPYIIQNIPKTSPVNWKLVPDVISDPYNGPEIYPIPKNVLKIAEERSLTTNSSYGYILIPQSIISGKEGTKRKGSTKPCRICPSAIIQRLSGKLNN